ncbi:uncharacterized protein LOC122267876 isoform X2 [Penaeus japonicus]|nr:uncharacterized protein LOC122267876 isoform X2 [Penaeus japonicus]XP_042893997.1 uncharacterized protein LOC122267876 isoform X2 [Penaeus japonicus]XP_042893998.1 uncharacterized protein LOC122267876 isoform X2 [Penaeus japonicus]
MHTHPHFKSLVEAVNSAQEIDDLVGEALTYQALIDKRTSPWEMKCWNHEELQNFRIKLENVDRLYHIHFFDDQLEQREFELVVRMLHNKTHIFVQLSAGCDYTGFDCRGGGEIYISKDPQVFLKSVLEQDYDIQKIWRSMIDDGYDVEQPTEHDLKPMKLWHSIPMLKFLCHMAVYKNKEELKHYPQVLPKPVVDCIDEFIKLRMTRDHHDEVAQL